MRNDIRHPLKRVAIPSILLRGMKIIFLGPPNAGKPSTCLTDKETAIESELDATTRDIIDVLDMNTKV